MHIINIHFALTKCVVQLLKFYNDTYNSTLHIVPSEQERTRCILDEAEKIEKQSLRDALKNQPNDRLRQQNHNSINQPFLNAMKNLILHIRHRSFV